MSDGKDYKPFRYKEIVKERYLISKHCNTSYKDLGEITPTEKNYLLSFIKEEIDQANKLKEELKNRNKKGTN